MAATGVDIVKVGFWPQRAASERVVRRLGALALGRVRLVAVLLVDRGLDLSSSRPLRDAGFAGVMLDTADKRDGALPERLAARRAGEVRRTPCKAQGFLRAWRARCASRTCRASGAWPGRAGLSRRPVPRWRAHGAHRCRCGARRAPGDAESRSCGRALPHGAGGCYGALATGTRAYEQTDRASARKSGRGAAGRFGGARPHLRARAGAAGGARRLRGGAGRHAEGELHHRGGGGRRACRPKAMRSPRCPPTTTSWARCARVVADGHINLVETLAERIAEHCLADKRIVSVLVRVEKLERGPASVGVEIVRPRMAAAGR